MRPLVTIPLFILVFLIIIAIVLFYSLQKYIVYEQDGLSVRVPLLSGEDVSIRSDPDSTAPHGSGVVAEIVIDAPNYSGVTSNAGLDLSPVKALYVSSEDVNSGVLASAASLLEARGANALIIDMKPSGGRLTWSSSTYMSRAFDTSGTLEPAEVLSSLKDSGVYLIAQISCLADTLTATRDAPAALRASDGSIYSDSAGSWLDPYSSDTREYLTSLMDELAQLGFDEILLTNIIHPTAPVTYSQPLSFEPTPVTAVSSLAKKLTDHMSGTGVRVSALLSQDTVRTDGAGELNGQDLALFSEVFDRLYLYTTPEQLDSDSAAVTSAFDKGETGCRFVPIMSASGNTESWAIR